MRGCGPARIAGHQGSPRGHEPRDGLYPTGARDIQETPAPGDGRRPSARGSFCDAAGAESCGAAAPASSGGSSWWRWGRTQSEHQPPVMRTYRYRSFLWPAILILAGVVALLVNTGRIPVDRLYQLVNL